MKWTVGLKIGAGFGAVLAVLVVVGIGSYRTTYKLEAAADLVTHTYEVVNDIETFAKGMVDAETGERGYLLTGEEEYLEPYHAGVKQATGALDGLRRLTADNAVQQRHIQELEPLMAKRLSRLEGGIEARRSGGVDAGVRWMSSGEGKAAMDDIRQTLAAMRASEEGLLKSRAAESEATIANTRLTIVVGTIIAGAIAVAAGVLITRSISSRLREVTSASKRVAEGDLTGVDLQSRSRDEVGELVAAFTTMRSSLRDMAQQTRLATENVNSTAAEILAATQQQAAATKEQAATIQQITSTLEEITQSGGQIGERAKSVSTVVETSGGATQRGMKATQDTSLTMEAIRDQIEEVAENVVGLSERTQTIGEIVATVSEIAEQSNLLALNASIEAVSAGEQGGRFLVVAHEMKNLADRAKDCTVQVRTILGEVQKGINTSVMLTEEAVKRAEGGKAQAHATEATIREVTETNGQSIQAFQQIVAGANQQQIGVGQVTQGMQDIRQAVKQTAASTAQLEKAAANMNALSQQLHRAAERYKV